MMTGSQLDFQPQLKQSISTKKRLNKSVVTFAEIKQKLISLLVLLFLIVSNTSSFLSQTNKLAKIEKSVTQANPNQQTIPTAELVVQTGHSDDIRKVLFSPDGKIVASSSADDKIIIWDVASGKELRSFSEQFAFISLFSFSPDGKTIALIKNGEIILWDIEKGKTVKKLTGQFEEIQSVSFNPNKKILAASVENSIRIWDIESGKEIKMLDDSEDVNRDQDAVAFSPDGKQIAFCNNGGPIKLWDVENWKEIKTFETSTQSISFSPDGKILVLTENNYGGLIRLIDIESGDQLKQPAIKDPINIIFFSPDGKIIVSSVSEGKIRIWDFKTGAELKTLAVDKKVSGLESFSPDGKLLLSSKDNEITVWDVETGRELRKLAGAFSSQIRSVALSPDGKTVVTGAQMDFDDTIRLWDLVNGQELKVLKGHEDGINAVAFSKDSKMLVSASEDKTVKVWDVESGKLLQTLAEHEDSINSISFSPDGKTFASGSNDGTVKFWNLKSKDSLRTIQTDGEGVAAAVFSPDGQTIATGSLGGEISFWDLRTGKSSKPIKVDMEGLASLFFSSDGKILASSGFEGVKFWDVKSGKELKETADKKLTKLFPILNEEVYIGAVSENLIVKMTENVKIRLLDRKTGKELATLVALEGNDWVIVTPEGRFDTSKIENPQGLHWVVSDNPMKTVPFEIFMRDYYEPKLLSRLLKCNKDNSCDKEFTPLPNIAELNRVQPSVRITNISEPDKEGKVKVSVEVGKALISASDCRMKKCQTEVYDLRLFRDGQLVGNFPADAQEKLIQQRDYQFKNLERKKELWRNATKINLDSKTGKQILNFEVQIPKNKEATRVRFSAYAFNDDRVKSRTWVRSLQVQPNPTEAKGNAYIITIGVNANQDNRYDLNYAVNDARIIQSEISGRLSNGRFEKVVQIPLISDYEKGSQRLGIKGERKLAENNAVKAKIKAVFDKLAGKQVGATDLKGIPNQELLKKVQPEDLVLISFSGHGYADREGIFYLIPYDIGKTTNKGLASVLDKSISSDELSLWLRDIDAGEMMMIVDACHSAAAVQGKDFKPGPMGSRGLGQLSYDKGMRILTATQADNVALELGKLQHGLLTYSLVKDGIELGLADFQPKDSKLFSNEWLSFAVKDVPELYKNIQSGKSRSVQIKGKKSRGEVIYLDEEKSNLNLQIPSLFDFNRRDKPFELMNLVLKSGSANK